MHISYRVCVKYVDPIATQFHLATQIAVKNLCRYFAKDFASYKHHFVTIQPVSRTTKGKFPSKQKQSALVQIF